MFVHITVQASASSIMLFYSYVCIAYLCKGLQVSNSVRFLRLYSIFVPASASSNAVPFACLNSIFVPASASSNAAPLARLNSILVQASANIIQSALVISKSKGPSETLRDIRNSTYQIYRTEENTNRTTKFHK